MQRGLVVLRFRAGRGRRTRRDRARVGRRSARAASAPERDDPGRVAGRRSMSMKMTCSADFPRSLRSNAIRSGGSTATTITASASQTVVQERSRLPHELVVIRVNEGIVLETRRDTVHRVGGAVVQHIIRVGPKRAVPRGAECVAGSRDRRGSRRRRSGRRFDQFDQDAAGGLGMDEVDPGSGGTAAWFVVQEVGAAFAQGGARPHRGRGRGRRAAGCLDRAWSGTRDRRRRPTAARAAGSTSRLSPTESIASRTPCSSLISSCATVMPNVSA